MFSQLFHLKVLDSEYLRFTIRSDQHRVDEYILGRLDIEPALDDDPTDNLWSGSTQFSLKRTKVHGYIKVKVNGHSVVHKVSRQDIEILNAQLKGILESLPLLSTSSTVTQSRQVIQDSVSSHDSLVEELVGRFRNMLREELKATQVQVPIVAPTPLERPQETPLASIPQVMFIPSTIGQNVAGDIKTDGTESSALSALEAARKLKEMKK